MANMEPVKQAKPLPGLLGGEKNALSWKVNVTFAS